NSIMEYLPIHPKFYPDDQLTDEPEKFFVAEKIREKILEIYHDEIPYSVEVYIEQFKEREKGKDYISAVIVVERESQKPIILGKKGSSIKKLGNAARQSIEDFLMREVYLELRVKVVENWRKDKRALKNFGYTY
ncbi:MAG: GTPase Era, partial [Ignavibacteriae bacterium]|nr:GTPase Era [Ignavibacteriota bacterium]